MKIEGLEKGFDAGSCERQLNIPDPMGECNRRLDSLFFVCWNFNHRLHCVCNLHTHDPLNELLGGYAQESQL